MAPPHRALPPSTPRRPTRLTWLLGPAIALGVASASHAQTVTVRVVDEASGQPIEGALVALRAASGDAAAASALTDALGRARLAAGSGSYRVDAQMIGYHDAPGQPLRVQGGAALTVEIALRARPIGIRGVDVEADQRCRLRPAEGLQVAEVWNEIRKALEAARWTSERGIYAYQIEERTRDVDQRDGSVLGEERSDVAGFASAPFESLPADRLAAEGYVQRARDGEGYLYYAPDAEVLLSDEFLDTHCMRLTLGTRGRDGWVGLAFEPVGGRSVPEISGVLWLDPGSWVLRHLDYGYENVRRDVTLRDVGGDVRFQRLPDGTWIVPEWSIRMPLLGRTRDMRGRERLLQVGLREQTGRLLRLRDRSGAVLLTAGSGTVRGTVVDSLGTNPVPGATVELLGEPERVTTDETGGFVFAGLAPGRYRMTFRHPTLTAYGYEPTTASVAVEAGAVSAHTLRMPSRPELLAAVCAFEGGPEPGRGWIAGTLQDPATGLPLPGGRVRIEWERSSEAEGLEALANHAGVYRACSVPLAREIMMTPSWGAFQGPGGTVRVPAMGRAVAHDLSIPVSGQGTVAGVVRETTTRAPVDGVTVRLDVDEGPDLTAVTDDAGRFVFENAPAGTRRLSIAHAAYHGGSGQVALRPGERVELRVGLPPIPTELRRLLPSFAARASTLTVEVVDRVLAGPPPG